MPKRKLFFTVFPVIILLGLAILFGWRIQKNKTSAQVAGPAEYVPGEILVKFKDGVSKEKKDKFIADNKLKEKKEIPEIGVKVLELPTKGNEKQFVANFKANSDIDLAELNHLDKPDLIPNDQYYSLQWHLPKISAPGAWDKTTGNSNTVIAILDTGVDGTHPDLAGNLIPGWNVYNDNNDTRDVYTASITGHGTATAGVAAAVMNNSIGVAGVCGNCKIMPIRIGDSSGYGYASDADAADGLMWAMNHGARVANCSYAKTGQPVFQSAADVFKGQGGVLTVSSGNTGSRVATLDYPSIITVGGTDGNDNWWNHATYGPALDVVAPSLNIATTGKGSSQYYYMDGTSFSAPMVAGVAGLMRSVNPVLSSAQVEDLLEKNADDKGAVGWDEVYGWGRVNAQRAVEAAAAYDTPPTVAITSPADHSIIRGTSVRIAASATDNIGVTKVEFYLNRSLIKTITVAPYSFSWPLRPSLRPTTFMLYAKAYDTKGNVSTSRTITFTH